MKLELEKANLRAAALDQEREELRKQLDQRNSALESNVEKHAEKFAEQHTLNKGVDLERVVEGKMQAIEDKYAGRMDRTFVEIASLFARISTQLQEKKHCRQGARAFEEAAMRELGCLQSAFTQG